MKNKYIIGILSLVLVFSGCNDSNKEKTTDSNLSSNTEPLAFEISTEGIKQSYVPEEEIQLKITAPLGSPIDSVLYSVNSVFIGKSVGNTPVNYRFDDSRYGEKKITAEIYKDSVKTETNLFLSLLPNSDPKILSYQIVNTYPHDIKAFTQGLEFYGDMLVESTGNGEGPSGKKGKSSVRIVNPKTGVPSKIVELDDRIFGEGATVLNGNLYQLTYKDNLANVYDINTLKHIKTLPYFQQMEGWGLTTDGKYLYMSDGTEKIYLLDPENFSKVDYIQVVTNKGTIARANEMEWVNGKIYANFFMDNVVGIINPKNGAVESIVDLSELRTKVTQHTDLDVLNGIAYNKKSKTFFVTGKNWDKMFEIKILD